RYMAPECLLGTPATARSDQFSFGVVAAELLGGAPRRDGPSVRWDHAALPPELDAVVRRCVELDPARRFPSMTEGRRALRERAPGVLAGGTLSMPDAAEPLRERACLGEDGAGAESAASTR